MINPYFMFAKGIGNSYSTIKNGGVRVDGMKMAAHYKRWRVDFDPVEIIRADPTA